MSVNECDRAAVLRKVSIFCVTANNLIINEAIDFKFWNTSERFSVNEVDSKQVTFGWKWDIQ
jgi:hypothetical protein